MATPPTDRTNVTTLLRLRRLRMSLLAFGALLALGLPASLGYRLWSERQQVFSTATRNAENLSEILEEYVAQTITRVDLVLENLTESLAELRRDNNGQTSAIKALLARKHGSNPTIRNFLVIDRTGRNIGDTTFRGMEADHTTRDYYLAHRDNLNLGLFISRPARNEQTNEWLIYVSRRLTGSDDSFAGVVVAVIEPSYFYRFYRSIDVGPNGDAGVLFRNSVAVAGSPFGQFLFGTDTEQSELWKNSPTEPGTRQVQLFEGADGISVIISLIFVGTVLLLTALLARQLARVAMSEATLRKTEAQYDTLVANIPGVVYQRRLAPDGTVTYPWLSAGVRDVHGYEPEEVLANPRLFLDGIHAEDRTDYKTAIAASVTDMAPLTWEGRIRTKTGPYKWVQILSRPRSTDDGSIIWDGIILEVTGRKEIESSLSMVRRQLEMKSAQFEAALSNMAQGLCLYDADTRLLVFNRRYLDLYKLPASEIRPGITLREIMEKSTSLGNYAPESVESTIAERIAIAQLRQPRVFFQRLKSGRVIEIAHQPLPDGGSVATHTDVTERENTAEALRSAKEVAELADRAKSEFLANMSHELRTPLNAIIGFSEIMCSELYGKLGDPRYAEYVRDIRDSGGHLLELINDILDLSKIEAGKSTLHEEDVDIARLLTVSTRLVRDRARIAGVGMETELAADLPAVRADEIKLKQIVLNLLSNAIKFSPSGGRITIHAGIEPSGKLEIAITDTGVGMRAEDIPIAMMPFRQVDSSLARRHEGTGLGLPLAKGLVEMHDGELAIESTPGRGTTVTIRLPAHRVRAVAPTGTARRSAGV
ncbi:MAG: PAS-domain containing protein [Rhodospirillales bacterium]|nr:PAS-domain containing protein [Rhodospirillales bacterium]